MVAKKHLTLFITGGILYILIELLWRGRSHWTMFLLGGACFVILGLINEVISWDMPLIQQMCIGACIITYMELIIGSIVNLWLNWNVWDYSNIPGNFMGQICPQYSLLWMPVSLAAIILDDWLRYWWFHEEKPHYRL